MHPLLSALLLHLVAITESHLSLPSYDPWASFRRVMQNEDKAEALDYNVIILRAGQSAVVDCSSPDLTPVLHVDKGPADEENGTPQEQVIESYERPVLIDEPCEAFTQVSDPRLVHTLVNKCRYTVNYTIHDFWMKCDVAEYSPVTSIRLVVSPKRMPNTYPEPPPTNHMDWWCLRNRNRTYAEAGHLLWSSWTLLGDDPYHLQSWGSVERFRAWELEPGDLFECNGTVWEWGKHYSCLSILPSGWPALVHCHGPEKAAIILLIIAAFVLLYANGVAAVNAYYYVKTTIRQYLQRNDLIESKARGEVPLVARDKSKPYSNMPDITVLLNDDKRIRSESEKHQKRLESLPYYEI